MSRDRFVDHFLQQPHRAKKNRKRGFFAWWRFFPNDIPVHKIGRTSPGIEPMYSEQDVEDLIDDLGIQRCRGWNELSTLQKADMIATRYLEQHREGIRHSVTILSRNQFWERTRREIPMELGALDALLVHHRHCRIYQGGRSGLSAKGEVAWERYLEQWGVDE